MSKTSPHLPRISFGRMVNPVRGFLHGTSAIIALLLLPWSLVAAETMRGKVGVSVFLLAAASLFSVSALYHSVAWTLKWKKRMQRVDHSMILVMIAGTFVPMILLVVVPPWNIVALIATWGIVLVGVGQHIFFPREKQNLSMALALTLGWLGLALGWPLISQAGIWAGALTLFGGMVYTVGTVLLIKERPVLWPRIFSYHELFHVMVIFAAAVHFSMIYVFLLPISI